jgi:CheY-like chemotaxis protein
MIELLRASISKHARLGADLAEHLPAVLANTTQVRQVLMNLVINASDAIGDKDGSIRIATSTVTVTQDPSGAAGADPPEGDYVRIEIADTGSGMSEESRRRVFDRSFTTKADGHGLGLAVVQGIVRSHGGVVNVTSALGHGTTFEVLLPCAGNIAGRVPRMAPAMALASINTGTKAALLVEREEHLRISVAKALRRRGFSVLSSPDARAAEDIMRNRGEDIDVVVLDLATRGASGADDLSRLRRLRPDVPVILTGDEAGSELTAAESGISFLRKPYRIAELLESLRSAIGDARQAPSHTEVAEAGSD